MVRGRARSSTRSVAGAGYSLAMRAALASVLLLSAAALAQDSARPRPVGSALLDALPAQTDLVVATPDLPALLDAATKAGLGDVDSWRNAFDRQIDKWGAPT